MLRAGGCALPTLVARSVPAMRCHAGRCNYLAGSCHGALLEQVGQGSRIVLHATAPHPLTCYLPAYLPSWFLKLRT